MSSGCCICSFVTSIVIIILVFILKAALYGDEDDYDYYYSDNDDDSTGPGGGKYSNSFIFGGGRHGSSGGSRFGSGSRGGGYCFSDSTAVWTKNETSPDATANQIMVTNLREGDLVGTLDASSATNQYYKFMWTRATDVSIYHGKWRAHTFVFSKQLYLTVTSPHLMIILKEEKFYFKRADQVEISDIMLVNKRLIKVTHIKNHLIKRKVAIETEDGTLQVNGVWVSGFCDNNVEANYRIVEYKSVIDDYKFRHFGEDFDSMCMDKVSWKIAYHRNNKLFR